MGRTRKTIVAISAGLVSVLIMAGVAAASRGSNDANPVRPVGVEDNSTSMPSSPITTGGTVVTPPSEPEHAQPEPGDDNGQDAVDNDTPTWAPDDTSTSMPDDNTTTTVVPIVAGERTFTVAGGTVVVNIDAGRSLTLVSVTPNPGVEVKDQRSESNEVRVDFRGPNGDSRVRVRFDEGQLRIETRDN